MTGTAERTPGSARVPVNMTNAVPRVAHPATRAAARTMRSACGGRVPIRSANKPPIPNCHARAIVLKYAASGFVSEIHTLNPRLATVTAARTPKAKPRLLPPRARRRLPESAAERDATRSDRDEGFRYHQVHEMRCAVMRNPLIAKNTSTPRNPPGSQPGHRWFTTTASTAAARRA